MDEVAVRPAQPDNGQENARAIESDTAHSLGRSSTVLNSIPVSQVLGQGRRLIGTVLVALAIALLVASGLGPVVDVLWASTGQLTVSYSANLAKKAGALPAEAAELAPSGAGRVVAIDPGHGGAEIGAQHNFSGGTSLLEKDLNLSVAVKVADLLARAGYQPVLTRKTDSQVNDPPKLITGRLPVGLDDDLQARVDIANNARAQLLLSIHFNGNADSSLRGSEVYYNDDRPFAADSRRFAQLLRQNLVNGLGGIGYQQVGAVKVDMAALRPGEHFYVLGPRSDIIVRSSAMPAALAEGLSLTNSYDARLLRDENTLDVIALAYATAVHHYFAGESSKLPGPRIGQDTIATDGGVGALLRAAPSTQGGIVRAMPDGATVDLLEMNGGEAVIDGENRWYRARYDGSEGYVYAALLLNRSGSSSVPSTGIANSIGKGTLKTQAGTGALLRVEPDSVGDVVRAIPEGETIDLLQAVSGEAVVPGDTSWYRARYDGSEGYVYAMLVMNSSGVGSVLSTEASARLGKGTVKTRLGTGALLREEPDSASAIVRTLPEGEVIDLLQLTSGEAVIPGDARWYRARYDGRVGYVYAYLLALG